MKTKLAIAVMCIMTYSAQADYVADQQYLSGQSFVLRWYDSSDLKSKAGNRKANEACEDFYKTIVSNQQYPSQDWIEGCAYAFQSKRGW
jgi:hypothetical protein